MDISALAKQLGLGLLKQTSIEPKITLQQGSIVQAKVQSVHPPDLAVLLLDGVQLNAKVNQMPRPGELLNLRVSGQNPSTGQIELQVVHAVIEPEQSQIPTQFQTQVQSQAPFSSDAELNGWLLTLSNSERQLAEKVSAVLEQAAIPASMEELKPIVAALNGQTLTDAMIKTAILSQSLGLPLEPPVLHALQTVLYGPSFGTLLDEFNQYAADLIVSTENPNSNSAPVFSQTSPPGQSAAQYENAAANWTEAAALLPEVVPPLSQPVQKLAVLQEVFQKLNSALSEPDSSKAQILLKQSVSTIGLADDARLYRLLLTGSGALETVLTGRTSLKQILQEQIASANQSATPLERGSQPVSGSSLATVVSHLADHLSGQQLLHGAHSNSPFTYQNFAFPLFFSQGQTGSAHIHLLGRKTGSGGRQLDAANCTLFFRLELPGLGQTDIYVQVIERNISLRFTVEPDVALPLLPSDLEELTTAFSKFGYQLGNVHTATRNEAAPEPLFFYLTEMRSRTNSIHILA